VFVYNGSKGLWQVSAGGGEPKLVAPVDSEQAGPLVWMDLLPGGEAALATIENSNARQVVVVSLETRKLTVLLDGMFPRYVPTGHIVYWREDSLWAVPFDASRLTLGGPPAPVLEGVRADSNAVARFAVGGNVPATT
jgi:serine/threonine-protein kinase